MPSSIQTRGQRVFTCGHSFHTWIAPLLLDMANAAGIKGHEIAGVAMVGGSAGKPPYLMHHWNLPDAENPVKQALATGKVDVLTLSPIWLPDGGIENFARLALKHNPATRVLVQAFWLPNDMYDPVYPLPTRLPVDHNQTDLHQLRQAHVPYWKAMEDNVREANAKLDRPGVSITPVGHAVLELREHIVAGRAPGLLEQWDLFHDSWGHPRPVLQLLAAYCHFAMIYQRSPEGLPLPAEESFAPHWAANRPWRGEDLNRLLQQLAWKAVIGKSI